jgi:hypothetical protein
MLGQMANVGDPHARVGRRIMLISSRSWLGLESRCACQCRLLLNHLESKERMKKSNESQGQQCRNTPKKKNKTKE